MNFKNVFESVNATGGASYALTTGQLNPKTGYMVALPGYELKLDQPASLPEFRNQVRDYLSHVNGDRKAFNKIYFNGAFIGLWKNESKLVYDIAENIADRDKAIELGRKRKQLAIWDCANQCEIPTNF